jgi:NADPH:quinone reductase
MTDTMRAIVLDAPGPPDALKIRELPVPTPAVGWVLIEVKAFGLNRSEVHTRQGLASGVTFPRVLGIEATGVVAECPADEFPVGQQVVTMMGGMGRTFDGGYAEYSCVPASQVILFASDLEWSISAPYPTCCRRHTARSPSASTRDPSSRSSSAAERLRCAWQRQSSPNSGT